jgi:hypothetical protein
LESLRSMADFRGNNPLAYGVLNACAPALLRLCRPACPTPLFSSMMTHRLRTSLAAASLLLLSFSSSAQVTGGQHIFEFLRLPQSPHLSALGSINVGNPSQEIAFGLQNPALMRPALHNELGLSYNSYYAGISIANLAYGYYLPRLANTSVILGVQYINYGSFEQNDFIGITQGSVQARDFAVSLGASHAYGERWRYGAALKVAYSGFASNVASGLMADVGISYTDTASLVSFGATAKNIGFLMTKFNGSGDEPLPFDLQMTISKRFAHLPLRVMATLHHLYEWDVRYNNPADLESSSLIGAPDSSALTRPYFADKLFRHFIFAAELVPGNRLTLTVSYNHLHRGELALKDKTGLAGFAFGVGINLNKFQVHYARSYYHIAGAYNEFGLSMRLGKLTGIGRATQRWGWDKEYPEKQL